MATKDFTSPFNLIYNESFLTPFKKMSVSHFLPFIFDRSCHHISIYFTSNSEILQNDLGTKFQGGGNFPQRFAAVLMAMFREFLRVELGLAGGPPETWRVTPLHPWKMYKCPLKRHHFKWIFYLKQPFPTINERRSPMIFVEAVFQREMNHLNQLNQKLPGDIC